MFSKRILSRVCFILINAATVLAVLVASALLPQGVLAFGATITVTTVADNLTTDGQCSLREAITNANNNTTSSPDCAAGLSGSGDVIVFASALGNAVIRPASTLPAITDATGLTIDGGSRITLSGDTDANGTGDIQLLYLNSITPFTLENLTIEKGHTSGYGGAISSSGTLTLDNVSVRNNSSDVEGGAIDQTNGSLTITASTFSGNTSLTGGAAIHYNSGTILIQDTTFQNNTTTDSGSTYGAISGDGTLSLTIQRSTFDTNVAKYGGGIFFSSGTLNVENSTFYGNGNSTGGVAGAIYASDGTLNLTNDTMANNLTNGLTLGSTVLLNMTNTILADNAMNDCYAYTGETAGTITNNLVTTLPAGPNNCGLSAGVIPDLGLGPLADNGGLTQTRALLPGSPAIDAGDSASCPTTDQRGAARPLDGNGDFAINCDIGAYEVRPPTTTTITSDAPDYSVSGSAVTVNVSVAVDIGWNSGTPSGSVAVSAPGSSCQAVLSAGAGSCVLHPTGSHLETILAMYLGDPSHDPSSDTESHLVAAAPIIYSTASQDGWVLESSETSGVGGTWNAAATTFKLGDDPANKQYRTVLSFNTGPSIPDTAVVLAVNLKLRKQAIVGGGNPVTLFQGFVVDLKRGFFGTSVLEPTDFQAKATKSLGPFMTAPVGNWYSFNLTPGRAYVNKLATASGLTQIRLRFTLDDNHNALANDLSLFSGNAPVATRPQLIVTYYMP